MVLEVKPKEEKNSLTYTIQNFVVTSSLPINEGLDLRLLNNKLNNSKYDSNRFPGLFLRFSHPKCVVIIFKNGKLILTGLKLSSDIELVLERLVLNLNKIKTLGILAEDVKSEIVNIVVTANFFRKINLDAGTIKLSNAIYEPEVFPGLIYNSLTPTKCVFLIFSTGKVVLTGIREEAVIGPVLTYLGRLLKKEKLFREI
ncbi:MAG: TATA-box-binding protein [Promethearchaeota archaeon]|jgi:transcription initiation factor TFIID TATA-box-binding protein